jgi:DNA-binding MarR family transcriptional regulator
LLGGHSVLLNEWKWLGVKVVHQPLLKSTAGCLTSTLARYWIVLNDFLVSLHYHLAMPPIHHANTHPDWRQAHLGRLLGHALRRFDDRVLHLMAHHVEVPLALANLAGRGQVSAAHIHITRHLSLHGSRLTALAERANMSKQAMGDLVTQCEAWGLVRREPDPQDARARRIVFTDTGLAWLRAFELAVAQAEAEFRQEVGPDVATVISLGLEAYAGAYSGLESEA